MTRPELCYCAVCGGVILPVDVAVERGDEWECALCNEPYPDSFAGDDDEEEGDDMKAIKCPNCGLKMDQKEKIDLRKGTCIGWMECASCGVRGPTTGDEQDPHVMRKNAARLTREWIERMEAKTCDRVGSCPYLKALKRLKPYPFQKKIICDIIKYED